MDPSDARRNLPVWRCTQVDICGEQWASEHEASACPLCHQPGSAELAGFTYGEALDACARFGFEDPKILVAEPVPELVLLTSLPKDLWQGLPVFHPLGQEGQSACWLTYDVGVVIEVSPDPALPGAWRVRFLHALGGHSGTLRYSPDNLWVPKVLADRLSTYR